MKRALSVATMTALTLFALLFVGYAQEATTTAVPALLEQELTAMEAAFGSVQSVMAELITEVKGNMSGLGDLSARVRDLKDIISAVSLELKAAEGKLADSARTSMPSEHALRSRVLGSSPSRPGCPSSLPSATR
jgi:hypothetical protein